MEKEREREKEVEKEKVRNQKKKKRQKKLKKYQKKTYRKQNDGLRLALCKGMLGTAGGNRLGQRVIQRNGRNKE